MFAAFKRIFKKSPEKPLSGLRPRAESVAKEAGTASSQGTNLLPFQKGGTSKSSEALIRVSFQAILKHLPQELHGKISPPSSAKFCMPATQVLEQLVKGTVKVSYGELRRAAPLGIFKNTSDQDGRLVDLPLREILPQLKTGSFTRRPQQRIEVSDEVTDLFGRKGELLARLRVLDKNEVKSQMAPAAKAPVTPAPAEPEIPASTPEELPKAFAVPTSVPSPITPLPKLGSSSSGSIPLTMPISIPPVRPTASKPAAAAKPAMAATPAPSVAGLSETLTVPLIELSKHWPEAINQEIVQLNMIGAQCHIPLNEIGRALNNGVAQLPWGQVRAWIRPLPPKGVPSSQLETMLEIPLKLIASLNLAQTPPAPAKKASAVEAESIPAKKISQPMPAAPQAEQLAAAVAPSGAPTTEGDVIRVPLSAVVTVWPVSLRAELTMASMPTATLEVPRAVVEPGLKVGKIEFLWKELQTWLKPAPPPGLGAKYNAAPLELPLSVLVPLLFSKEAAAAPKRTSPADEIPDVFNANGRVNTIPPEPVSESVPVPEAAPAVESVPAPPASVPEPRPIPKAPKDLAELFGEPDKRNWTPNEIVHKTTLLPDVCGALIALQDGLLVASCMPPNWKTETIAAFLPQIFGRMNQYAKELKMGDLNSVTFTVEQGMLQIYNAGIIYFAALGNPGTTLPPSLNLIARELSRHTR